MASQMVVVGAGASQFDQGLIARIEKTQVGSTSTGTAFPTAETVAQFTINHYPIKRSKYRLLLLWNGEYTEYLDNGK